MFITQGWVVGIFIIVNAHLLNTIVLRGGITTDGYSKTKAVTGKYRFCILFQIHTVNFVKIKSNILPLIVQKCFN